jgi:tetratricopeptide (TPR) repeat protein
MGHFEWSLGYFDKAIKTLTKAAEICEAVGNAEDAGYAYVWLEWSHWFKGDYNQVLAYKEQVVRMMEQRFNLRWYVWALSSARHIC